MKRTLLKSKIQSATVTDANLHYEGSITIDRALMDEADLVPFEEVHVFNVNTGARFETYVIEGERNSGSVCVDGAAARLVQIGDKVIVVSHALYDGAQSCQHSPAIVAVTEANTAIPGPLEVAPGQRPFPSSID